MIQQKTLCWFNNVLFARIGWFDNRLCYLSKKESDRLYQKLYKITEIEKNDFDYFYFNDFSFLNGKLIVIPNPYNESEYFIFNYFERNNLFYVQTLSMNDCLGIIKHLDIFKAELKKIEEGGN